MSTTHNVRPRWVLPLIVLGQVLATSTWFAANAVAVDMGALWSQGESIGRITLMVQLGFIAGTLIVATSGLSDSMSGRRLFLISALMAALTNAAILCAPANYHFVLACRLATGISLAGVYPVGMKMAAGWYATGLGRALGYLVGALVLGTSLTHLLRAMNLGANWQLVILLSTLAAVLGGLLVSLIPDGPYLNRANRQSLRISDLREAWSDRGFRQAAMAYFGHMWELYAFWAFMPLWVGSLGLGPATASLVCFLIIAVGSLGCVLGGIAAETWGSRVVARSFLGASFLCCLLSPLIYQTSLLIPGLIVWGIAAVGDSPQLSSLNAQAAPRHLVGSALTATTCIGFSITVLSLLCLDSLVTCIEPRYLFLTLAIGPCIGYLSLRPKQFEKR